VGRTNICILSLLIGNPLALMIMPPIINLSFLEFISQQPRIRTPAISRSWCEPPLCTKDLCAINVAQIIFEKFAHLFGIHVCEIVPQIIHFPGIFSSVHGNFVVEI